MDADNEMKRKRKVLEVVYAFGYGGISAFVLNYLKHLDKDRFDVDIYAFGQDSSPFTNKVRELGGEIYFEPANDAAGHIVRFVRKLVAHLREHGPYDVVHAHNNLISGLVVLAAKIAGVPVRLSHSHSSSHFTSSPIQRAYSYLRRGLINMFATRKLACGRMAGEAMYGEGADFLIAANGIDVDRFYNTDEKRVELLREKFGIPVEAKVYANVSRLDPVKNHLFAVKVFEEILKSDPKAIFLYGGVVPDVDCTLAEVEAEIDRRGLREHTFFTEPVMDVESLYHLTDAWIFCSLHEGLPFGPLELQAAGVPVLCSDKVITREIDLGLGLVQYESLDASPARWAEKLLKMKPVKIEKKKLEETFRKYNFEIKQNVKFLESIYEGN